jgi:hypothetical protein
MTFFYDLNKRLADLAKKQDLKESVGSTSGFLEGSTGDYSAKKAAAGKDIGKPGKMFSKIAKSAGKEYGSKAAGQRVAGAVLNKLRTKEDVAQEGNAFSGAVARAKADGVQPGEKIKVGGKTYPVKEQGGVPMTPKQKSFAKLAPPANKITFADKIAGAKKEVDEMLGDVAAEAIKSAIQKKEPRSKGTAFDPEVAKGMFSGEKNKTRTGHDVKDTGYSKRYTKSLQDEPEADDEKSNAPKVKGRPKGTKRAIGAKGPTGKSKLMSKGSIKETDMEEDYDKDEYDEEGEMARSQARTIADAAKELQDMVGDNENLPEWVQKKINLATEYIDAARDYLKANRPEDGVVAEKAVSKAQRKAAGIAHAAKKGDIPKKELRGASKEMAKMPAGELKKFAKTKETGLPKKVKEAESEAKPAKSSGFEFGKGVYEGMNKKYTQMLNEGMNITVNMGTGDGEPRKSITVTAEGDDADKLAELLKMAGMGQAHGDACGTCGQAPCGCEEELEENSPDWPTNTETSDNAMQYSGGLNGPKSTGQTTVPVIASQLRRQVSMEESVELERSLFKLYNAYKAQ